MLSRNHTVPLALPQREWQKGQALRHKELEGTTGQSGPRHLLPGTGGKASALGCPKGPALAALAEVSLVSPREGPATCW